MENVVIQPSAIAGKGVFANRAFRHGEAIFKLEGPTIHYAFEPDYRVWPHCLQIGPKVWKIPQHGNAWRYINHSCEPNVGIRQQSTVVAMRNIHPGEEITVDYSMTEAGRHWHMRCSCGSTGCRSIIRSAQFLPRTLFDHYRDFIPAYLKNVYLSEKAYTPYLPKRGGVFAKQPIKKGERIFHVEGPTVRYQFPPDYHVGYQWLAIAVNAWIIPLRGSLWWSIRHSCEPNVGVIRNGVIVAMRDIAPDEELAVDDSTTEADMTWKHRCRCGTPNCRKLIRSVQFLPKELFERYKPYMSTFLKQQYRAHQNSTVAK